MAEIDAARYVEALKAQRNAALDSAAEWRTIAETRAVEVASLHAEIDARPTPEHTVTPAAAKGAAAALLRSVNDKPEAG